MTKPGSEPLQLAPVTEETILEVLEAAAAEGTREFYERLKAELKAPENAPYAKLIRGRLKELDPMEMSRTLETVLLTLEVVRAQITKDHQIAQQN